MTPQIKRSQVQNYAFGAILVLLFILVCRLFAPFFTVLLWSVLFYIVLSPLYLRLTRKLDKRNLKGKILLSVWAGIFSVGTVVIILIPLSFVVFQFYRQGMELVEFIRGFLGSHSGEDAGTVFLDDLAEKVNEFSSGQLEFTGETIRLRILQFLSSGAQRLFQMSRGIAMNIGSFLIGMALMLFSLFFFFLDGTYLSRLALHSIPIRNDYTRTLVTKFKDITKNLVLGYLIVALIQAVVAFIVYTIFGAKGALVLAALTFFCAFIPIIGPGIIWMPLGVIRIIGGDTGGGILLMAVAGLTISTLDYLLRPFFLRDRIQLHPLIIFFAIMGGISVFGFNGIILGPMVVILFLTVLDLFLTEHKIKQDQEQP